MFIREQAELEEGGEEEDEQGVAVLELWDLGNCQTSDHLVTQAVQHLLTPEENGKRPLQQERHLTPHLLSLNLC